MTAVVTGAAAPAGALCADEVVAHTLLNCYLREVAHPDRQATLVDGELRIRLPRQDVLLCVAVRRPAMSGAHRFTGGISRGGDRIPVDWRRLAEYLAEELRRATGVANEEFTAQVAASHAVTRALLLHPRTANAVDGRYLESERALLLGHRFHPTPKSRSGANSRWPVYAPETGAWLAPRVLGVRAELVRQQRIDAGDLAIVDGVRAAPDGYLPLPVHPWQYELLRGHHRLDAALRAGEVVDLGPGQVRFAATSSVRTGYRPDGYLKFSLNVRITDRVRRHAAHELTGAVALTGLLDGELAGWRAKYPGCAVLREPAYRTVDLAEPDLLAGFGVIVREGPDRYLLPGVTPLLAGAIADEYACSGAHVSRLLGEPATDRVLDWWRAYLAALLPPLLGAFFAHGVVFEPHLRNVLVGVDADGMPAQVLLRDLAGTGLVADRHAGFLRELDPAVARPLTHRPAQGWRRVASGLLVDHVSETLAALADLRPDLEARLWAMVREELTDCAAAHGWPAELRAVLAGVPVPAKANLLACWRRSEDRDADQLPLTLPL